MSPKPPTLFTLTHTQRPYQSEIAGAGPVNHNILRYMIHHVPCDELDFVCKQKYLSYLLLNIVIVQLLLY